jgi:hypothetical protein
LELRNGIRSFNIGVCLFKDEQKGVSNTALEELLFLYNLGVEVNEIKVVKKDLAKRTT